MLSWILLILIFIMLLLSSIISASETAITSISLVKLKSYIKKRNRSKKISKTALILLNNYSRTLMTILIFNTLINSAVAATFTILFASFIEDIKKADLALISTIASTLALLLIGEITPKIIAKKYAEQYFISIAWFLRFLSIILYPFLWWTKYIQERKNQDHISEAELLELINLISDNGILEINEQELVKSAIKFDDKKLKNIMVKQENVKFLYHDVKKEEIIKFYKNYSFSRVPVLHRVSKRVCGIIYIKDLLKKLLLDLDNEITINNLIRQPLFMYDNLTLDEAMKQMQEKQNHIAVIIPNNKTNNFLGIVTLEDLIEQITGKIYDEYDHPGKIKEIGHSKWIVYGDANVYNFFTSYLKIPSENINKNLKLLEWFILTSKKIVKNLKGLENKKITYKNYLFKVKSIDLKTKVVIFEINLVKIKNNIKK